MRVPSNRTTLAPECVTLSTRSPIYTAIAIGNSPLDTLLATRMEFSGTTVDFVNP